MAAVWSAAEAAISTDPSESALVAFEAASQDAVVDIVHLVSLYPYQDLGEDGDWIAPVMAVAAMALPDGEEGSSETTELTWSDRGWISGAGDAPAQVYFEGRVTQPLKIDRSMPIAPDASRRLAVQVGAIEAVGADGALDEIASSYPIDGRRVVVRRGRRTDPLADFAVLHDGSGVSYEVRRERLALNLSDNSFLADMPLQTTFYGGGGGADGTAEMTGKPKPILFGRCFNVSPVLIDPAYLVWQFHVRQAQAVDGVYDKGAALTFDANYASYAALIAAAIPAGRYATCLAEGMIRCQAQPSGQLTADLKGDAACGYVSVAADVAKRAATDFAGLALSALDLGSFSVLAAAAPYDVGFFAGAEEKPLLSDLFDQLAQSVGGWWGCQARGQIGIARLAEPASSYSMQLDDTNLLALDQVPLPQGLTPPPWRLAVGYRPNSTVQSADQLAGSVAAARVQTLAQKYLAEASFSAVVATRHIQARAPVPIETLLYDQASAAAEAARLIALHGVDRLMLEAKLGAPGFRLDLGQTVRVVNPRYGLASGKYMAVVGLALDCARGETVATLWG